MNDSVPTSKLAMYSWCGFAFDIIPFPFATRRRLSTQRTTVGYHPVGINPFERLTPNCSPSITARKLLSALATYNVELSGESATEFGVLPFRASGETDVEIVSITFIASRPMTDTELKFAFATKSRLPSFV